MNSEETPFAAGRDNVASRANIVVVAGACLLAAFVIYSVVAGQPRGWLVAIVATLALVFGGLLVDVARSKNVAWRSLGARFGQPFGAALERKNFATGRAQVGDYAYFGVRCFGSPGGLEIGRIASRLNRPVYIPWSAMAKIDTFPNLLTGRKGFETDMQAQISLRDWPDLTFQVPWLTEYRQLLPKSVRYRAIKLSKK